jgi:hypothetical protein
MPPVERRFAERHNIKVPLRVQMLRSAAPEQRAEALNISFQGVYFATNLPLHEGSPVQIALEMPEEVTRKPVAEWRCTGHVVHVQPHSSRQGTICVGIRFDCYEVLQSTQPSRAKATSK